MNLKIATGVWVAAIVGSIALLPALWLTGGWVFGVNGESVSMMSFKGGYHAWHIDYSHGSQLQPDGALKPIYKWPTIRHTDLRWLPKFSRDDSFWTTNVVKEVIGSLSITNR